MLIELDWRAFDWAGLNLAWCRLDWCGLDYIVLGRFKLARNCLYPPRRLEKNLDLFISVSFFGFGLDCASSEKVGLVRPGLFRLGLVRHL